MPTQLPLPNFLIIGAQKSATRWLRSNLGEHPDVFAATREIMFFNNGQRVDRLGTDWYRLQFKGWDDERFVGESTPGYMMWRHRPARVAERIDRTLPEVRLLAILRNPIDRAHSAMVHHMRRGRIPLDADLRELVRRQPPDKDRMGLVAGGWYAASLQPYVKLFGDRLLVFINDEVVRDAPALYARALRHIGADPEFVPAELDEVRFSNQRTDADAGTEDAFVPPPPPTQEARRALWEYFREDVEKLERLLDIDLSVWEAESGGRRRRPRRSSRTLHVWDPSVPEPVIDAFLSVSEWVEDLLEQTGGDVADVVEEVRGRLLESIAAIANTTMDDTSDHPPAVVPHEDGVEAYRTAARVVASAMKDREYLARSIPWLGRYIPAPFLLGKVLRQQVRLGEELAEVAGSATTAPENARQFSAEFAQRLYRELVAPS